MYKKDLILIKDEVLKLYNEGATVTELMKKYSTTNRHLILDIIRLAGGIVRLDYLTCAKKYNIDDTYFEKVDTEDKAYFLGLLYADGYNDTKNNCIRIILAEPDQYILETFKEYLKTNKPLRYYERTSKNPNWKNCWAIDIENKKMCLDLEKLGCMKAKTHILKFPTEEQLPSYLHNHFIRGYFDGDGCITTNSNSYFISFVGNADFIKKVQEILIKEINFSKTKLSKRHKDRIDNIVTLIYGGNIQLLRFRDYIYKDATVFLTRKKDKFYKIDVPILSD